MQGRQASWVVLAAALAACNSLDDKPEQLEPGAHLIVPTDTRAAVQALRTPTPIIGGTLALTRDGQFAIAADPERDRISVVNLATRATQEIELEEGVEPGRVVVDDFDRAHVALRRSGEVLTLDPRGGGIVARRHVCSAPRGLAYRRDNDQLEVACTNGELVTLRASGGEGEQRVQLPDDLRDIVISGDNHLVTRFKSAEVLQLGPENEMVSSFSPQRLSLSMTKIETVDEGNGVTNTFPVEEIHDMQPHVAYRTAASADGSIWMLHQLETNNEIAIEKDEDSAQAEASPYGGGGGTCSGIVQTAVTRVSFGEPIETMSVAGLVMAVDMAVSPNGQNLAIVQAGEEDFGAPRPTVQFVEEDGSISRDQVPGAAPSASAGSVALVSAQSGVGTGGCIFPNSVGLNGQATSVAYTPNGQLVVQLREPARLVIADDHESVTNGAGLLATGEIALGGESMTDTGHDLFHRNTGAGIACGSCHAEGGDDGHVWRFSTIGARRTQSVYVGLAGTLPFHWDGDMKDLGTLMEKVFVGRMGGVLQSKARLEVLENWMFSLRPPTPMVAAEDAAALRGKHLFESGKVGCAGCHNGAALTDNKSYDVGTEPGVKLQVPSLHGIGYRAPFIHTGCADTLAERFDPACGGGDLHGNTSHLDSEEVGDLVAYLKSL